MSEEIGNQTPSVEILRELREELSSLRKENKLISRRLRKLNIPGAKRALFQTKVTVIDPQCSVSKFIFSCNATWMT